MREIKFRAWDARCRDMVFFGLGQDHFGTCCLETGDCYMLELEDEPPVMQYTGLKDKNGVEIYEGDVLATENHEKLDMIDEWSRIVMGAVCLDVVSGLSVRHPDHPIAWLDTEDEDSIFHVKFVSVIGNIYENPDLLADSQEHGKIAT